MTERNKRQASKGNGNSATRHAAPGVSPDQSSGLTNEQRGTLKTVLENQRRQLTGAPDSGRGEGRYAREHSEAPHAMEEAEINSELQEHADEELELIEAALQRLDAGSYGVCCDCGTPIGFPRLEAYPIARRCIACKREYEHGQ